MRKSTIALVLIAPLALAACKGKECTKEVLDQKVNDLMTASQDLGSKDPAKMLTIGPKVADIVVRSQTETKDFQPICDDIDSVMKDIGG